MMQEDRAWLQQSLGINLVIEAGAGTGKTTTLIDRLCLCTLVQQTPVEKIVALTFTEKAAAEIKTRFIFKLQQLVQQAQQVEQDPHTDTSGPDWRTWHVLHEQCAIPPNEIIARAQKALAQLDRSCIGTIHSFCAEILKNFPLEAGLSPNAQIDTGTKATHIFEEHWNRFLDQQLGLQAPQPNVWKKVLAEISLAQLKEFAEQVAALKPIEYDYHSHETFLAKVCLEKASQLQQLYERYVPAKPRNIEKALIWAAQSLQRTSAFLQHTPVPPPSEKVCPAISTTLPKGWTEEDFEQARSLVGFAQKITPEKQTLFLTAYTLIAPLAQQVAQTYREEGVLGFDDLIIKTRDLLWHNLYVRRVLKEKFDILFIDEFQDTDPVQGELLLFLAEEKTAAASRWQDIKLQPGKLCVVGDPKQSIYRFRGADITAYELFTDLILKQGGKKGFLRNNFRSEPDIIQTANQVCSRAMVQETAFQPAYVPIFTTHPAGNPGTRWLFVTANSSEKPSADDMRHNQAQAIAQWIKQNVGKEHLKDGRLLAYRDIALLTRVGTSARIYTDALRRLNIPFNTETDADFFQKQEINDWLIFLRAVADPEDKIALAGVLRSPWGGLTDEQLYHLCQEDELSLDRLLACKQTATCAQQIKKFHQLAGRVLLGELLEQIAEETFLTEACARAYDGENTLSYLHQFIMWARQYQEQSGLCLAAFLTQLETQLATHPDLFNLSAADESADAVSLLTVHKSKGLEFPVVILADLSRKETATAQHPANHLFSWQYNMYGLRVGPVCDVHLAFLEEEQKKHSRCEEVRILYVALTRAREKLVLVADNRTGFEKGAIAFANAGLLPDGQNRSVTSNDGDLTLPITYSAYLPPREFIYQQTALSPVPAPLTDLSQWETAYQARERAYELALAHQNTAPSALTEQDSWTLQQKQGAELGSVCHRALELLVQKTFTQTILACQQAANELGAPLRACEATALLEPFVASTLFKQIQAHPCLACEMPFSVTLADGNIQNGIMDAVLQTPEGLWVVDYKTDQVTPGTEQALFERKYQAQLTQYRLAAQKIFPGKKIRVSAVFVRTFAAIEG